MACLGLSSDAIASSATVKIGNVTIQPGSALPVVSAARSFANNGVYTTQGIRVRVFAKNGGGSTAIRVVDFAPPGWTITPISPAGGVVDEGSTVTWTLAAFNADTTFTYDVTPPTPTHFIPSFFGAGLVYDDTNVLIVPITGTGTIYREDQTALFQDGRFPDPSYAGTWDVHMTPYQGPYGGGNPNIMFGLNPGWYDPLDEGDYTNALNPSDYHTLLLRFNLGSLSPSATVHEAKLMLFHANKAQNTSGASAVPEASTTLHVCTSKNSTAPGTRDAAPTATAAPMPTAARRPTTGQRPPSRLGAAGARAVEPPTEICPNRIPTPPRKP